MNPEARAAGVYAFATAPHSFHIVQAGAGQPSGIALRDAARGPGRAAARRFVLGALMLGAAVLAGCASTVPAQITTFNRPEAASMKWTGQRFVVQAQPTQADSLAFSSYATQVRQALEKRGLVAVDQLSAADVQVSFDYQAGQPTATSQGSSGGFSVGVGGGFRSNWGLGIGIPIGGSRTEETSYRHMLQVHINRVTGGEVTGERLYESTLVTESDSAAIAPQMPSMIDALFADFPGENGKTVTVQLPKAASR